MSTSTLLPLARAASIVYIYLGTPIVIGGVIGGILNILTFLSLLTYRSSSSAFYLTLGSIVNIGQLITGLLSRVLINALAVDWTLTSPFYCKFRNYLFQLCAVVSPALMCLATIDQFLAVSNRPRWQRWSHIKVAHYLSAIVTLFWILYGIPFLIIYDLIVPPDSSSAACLITNPIFARYYNDVHVPVVLCALPLSIMLVFGLLTYRNIKQIPYRTVPLIRRRHEIQLTRMVLAQVLFNLFAMTPCITVLTLVSNTTITNDPIVAAQIHFAIALTTCFYYLCFANPFYIYILTSGRFRQQLRYVLIDMHLNRWRGITANRIMPQ